MAEDHGTQTSDLPCLNVRETCRLDRNVIAREIHETFMTRRGEVVLPLPAGVR